MKSRYSKSKYLLLLSLDGLSSADFSTLHDLPNFSTLLSSGSVAREVEGVYPTQTYPLHVSLLTGEYPKKHGIPGNARFQPGNEDPDWYYHRQDIRITTLYEWADQAGLRVASLLWPVTAGARIRFNVPEIKPRVKQNVFFSILAGGTPLYVIKMAVRYGQQLRGLETYYLDNFLSSVADYTVRMKLPHLMLLHLLDLDKTRHLFGFTSREAQDSLKEADRRIGRVISAYKKAGIYDETSFIVLGDHAYFDVHSQININSIFRDEGLLTLDRKDRLETWKAWSTSCDGSAHVFLNPLSHMDTRQAVQDLLMELKDDSSYGIEDVYFGDTLDNLKVAGNVDFVLEGNPGFFFTNSMEGRPIEPAPSNYRATHGYRPDRENYSSLLIATGANIKEGISLRRIRLIDLAPTIGRLLGIPFPDREGRVLTELIESE